MSSSISNSNTTSRDRCPTDSLALQWLTAAIVFVVLIAGAETIYRLQGIPTLPKDSVDLWSSHLADALDDGPSRKTLVVLGASRAHVGFDPAVFTQQLNDAGHTGWRVILLAANGRDPKPPLAYLAERGFEGVVLFSYDAEWVARDDTNEMRTWVQHYHNNFYRAWSLNRRLNLACRSWLQHHLVMTQPRIEKSLKWWKAHKPMCMVIQDNRQLKGMFYERMNQTQRERMVRKNIERIEKGTRDAMGKNFHRWPEEQTALRTQVEQINRAGGRVVFLRYPTGGPLWAHHETMLPREKFWDRMMSDLQVESIHFCDMDLPEDLDFPDAGAHLDHKSAERFTRCLFTELNGRHLFNR